MDVLTEINKIVRLKMKLKGFKSIMVDTAVSRQHVYDIKGKGKLPKIAMERNSILLLKKLAEK